MDQPVIIITGASQGLDEIYQYFTELYEQGELLPPEIPALAAVRLAMQAPHDWSGEILQWDDEKVKALEEHE
jgi:hypothetical protein